MPGNSDGPLEYKGSKGCKGLIEWTMEATKSFQEDREQIERLTKVYFLSRKEKKGGPKTALWHCWWIDQAPPAALTTGSGLREALASSRLSRAMNLTLIPLGQAASHS